MRYLAITIILLMSSTSFAEVHNNLNNEITEASFSQQRLHRQLLRILQGLEVSIADNGPNAPVLQPAEKEYKVHLIKIGAN